MPWVGQWQDLSQEVACEEGQPAVTWGKSVAGPVT